MRTTFYNYFSDKFDVSMFVLLVVSLSVSVLVKSQNLGLFVGIIGLAVSVLGATSYYERIEQRIKWILLGVCSSVSIAILSNI